MSIRTQFNPLGSLKAGAIQVLDKLAIPPPTDTSIVKYMATTALEEDYIIPKFDSAGLEFHVELDNIHGLAPSDAPQQVMVSTATGDGAWDSPPGSTQIHQQGGGFYRSLIAAYDANRYYLLHDWRWPDPDAMKHYLVHMDSNYLTYDFAGEKDEGLINTWVHTRRQGTVQVNGIRGIDYDFIRIWINPAGGPSLEVLPVEYEGQKGLMLYRNGLPTKFSPVPQPGDDTGLPDA